MKDHKYTTDIPLARTRLSKIADRLENTGMHDLGKEIRDINEHLMTRRPGPRRAPSTRVQVTPEIREGVLHDLLNTKLAQEDIARKYNIDGGRVSEIYASTRN